MINIFKDIRPNVEVKPKHEPRDINIFGTPEALQGFETMVTLLLVGSLSLFFGMIYYVVK